VWLFSFPESEEKARQRMKMEKNCAAVARTLTNLGQGVYVTMQHESLINQVKGHN
jgi:hypothetical protein